MTSSIRILLQGNVQFKFDNGLIVSIYIGDGSYSHSTAKLGDTIDRIRNPPRVTGISSDAEVAVFVEGEMPWGIAMWVTHHFADCGDDVAGYRPIDEVLGILAHARTMTREEVAALTPREEVEA
jgi:hypothetical protein